MGGMLKLGLMSNIFDVGDIESALSHVKV